MSSLALVAAMVMAMMAPASAQISQSGPAPDSPRAVPGSTTGAATLTGTTQILTVGALEKMDLVGAVGKEIGTIDGVVELNVDNKQFALVKRGGLLGLGAKEISIPLENLAVQSGKVTVRNMDTAQLDGIPEFKNDDNVYHRLDGTQQISLSQLR